MNEITTDPIAQEINQLHEEIIGAIKMTLQKAIRIGELLAKKRAKFPPRSGWLDWLRENVRFSQKTTNRYMQCYENRAILVRVTNIELSQVYTLLQGANAYGELQKRIEEGAPFPVPKKKKKSVEELLEAVDTEEDNGKEEMPKGTGKSLSKKGPTDTEVYWGVIENLMGAELLVEKASKMFNLKQEELQKQGMQLDKTENLAAYCISLSNKTNQLLELIQPEKKYPSYLKVV